MQIFSNLQHKKQKRSLTGFTLLEVVVSIVLFTILSCFLMATVPSLIVKFRASAFKEQAIYLAKSKLEEYLYAAPAEDVGYNSDKQAFASPYNRYWYQVTIAAYGSNTNTNLVTVAVWGPTTNRNQTNINRVNLVGLAKAKINPDDLPTDLEARSALNGGVLFDLPAGASVTYIFYDPVNKLVILREVVSVGYSRYNIKFSLYNLSGRKVREYNFDGTYDNSGAYSLYFWGGAYNNAIQQFMGFYTRDNQGQHAGTMLYRLPKDPRLSYNSSRDLVWSIASGASGDYSYWNVMDRQLNAMACAGDGTTYFVQKSAGGGWGMNSVKVYIANPTASGAFTTTKVINIVRQPFGTWSSDLYGSFRDFPYNMLNISAGFNNNKVYLTLNMIGAPRSGTNWWEGVTLFECNKNLTTAKKMYTMNSSGQKVPLSGYQVDTDKYGNIYTSSKPWRASEVDSARYGTSVVKYRETSRDSNGCPVFTAVENITSCGNFVITPDGKDIISVEAKAPWPQPGYDRLCVKVRKLTP